MTNEDAIKCVAAFKRYLGDGNPIWDADEIREAFGMAVEALENKAEQSENQKGEAEARAQGEWIDTGDPVMRKCSNCGYDVFAYNCNNYCPKCGSEMRKRDK